VNKTCTEPVLYKRLHNQLYDVSEKTRYPLEEYTAIVQGRTKVQNDVLINVERGVNNDLIGLEHLQEIRNILYGVLKSTNTTTKSRNAAWLDAVFDSNPALIGKVLSTRIGLKRQLSISLRSDSTRTTREWTEEASRLLVYAGLSSNTRIARLQLQGAHRELVYSKRNLLASGFTLFKRGTDEIDWKLVESCSSRMYASK